MTILLVLYILCILDIAEGEEAVRKTLDIGSPDPSAFQCINCHIDSIPTMLFVAQEGTTIGRVMSGTKEIWMGVNCPLVLLHYHDGRPAFLRLITEDPAGTLDVLYEAKRSGWRKVENDTSMTSLPETTKTTIGVVADINFCIGGSINEVRTSWYGFYARVLVPDEHYYASEGGKDDKCILIMACMENGFPIAVHLLVRDKNGVVTSLFFVRDGPFKSATNEECRDRIGMVREEGCKSTQWAACV